MDVRGLTPVAGDALGGAVVWLGGARFAPEARCAWSGESAPGTSAFVSSALLCCEAPPLPTGAATVRAALYNETSDAATTFAALGVMASTSATPAVAHTGGGTHVTLAGDGLRDGADASCVFGTTRVAAAVIGVGRAACLTPAHVPGRVGAGMHVEALTDVGTVSFVFAGARAAGWICSSMRDSRSIACLLNPLVQTSPPRIHCCTACLRTHSKLR